MTIVSRLVPRSPKGIAIGSVVAILLLVFAWQGLSAWWNYGYSKGQRTGYIRKFSYRGSPLCKYWLGELVPVGPALSNPEPWIFTTDSSKDSDVLIQSVEKAEQSAHPVTVNYRQDRKKWWACAPTEYYVTGVSSF